MVELELLVGGNIEGLYVLTFKRAAEDMGDLCVPRKLHLDARDVTFAIRMEGPEPRYLN